MIAAHIRNDLRSKMKLDGLFDIDEIFMNGRLRKLLNVNENGEDYYNFGDMKLSSGWYKVPSYGSHYHQSRAPRITAWIEISSNDFTIYKNAYTRLNAKFMNRDGREAIFKWHGIYENSEPDRGTYNYFNGFLYPNKHDRFDVNPFKKYPPAGYDPCTLILHNFDYSPILDNSFYWKF